MILKKARGILLELIVIIWFVCGLIASTIANAKGRRGCSGFAIGCMLGPLGIIWELVTPADQAKVEDKAVKSGKMKKCPACAELVKTGATKCRHCGEILE